MASVAGGYGVMVQIPEDVLQHAVEAFTRSQSHLFRVDLSRALGLGDYGIDQSLLLGTQLIDPVITLVVPDELDLEFTIQAVARIETRIAALPHGPLPAPPPIIEASLSGRIRVRVAGKSIAALNHYYIAIDLRELRLTHFDLQLDRSNFTLSNRLLAVVSALARRSALKALSKNVGLLPVSWTVGTGVPVLTHPVTLDYRVVASNGNRALALLLNVAGEQTDLAQVSYALAMSTDTGVFIDLQLLNTILQFVCHVLEGYTLVDPGGIVGRLVVHDAAIHVEPGTFVLDNVEVQSSTMETVVRTVEKVICDAIDPFNWYCKKIVDTIIEVVQLDQLANAHGRFLPCVNASGSLKVDTSAIHVTLSYPMIVLVFLTVDALLPLGSFVTVILMVWGNLLLDRAVTRMVNAKDFDLAIDQPIPGTELHAKATPRAITWPAGMFAMMSSLRLA